MLALFALSTGASSLGCDRLSRKSETSKPAMQGQTVNARRPPAPPPSAAVAGSSPSADAGAAGPSDAALNVLVLSIDSLRADMPWNGYPRAIAPRLTELEKRAVSYTRAYAISSYTSMSLGGFLGGKLPSEMKRNGFFFGKYP